MSFAKRETDRYMYRCLTSGFVLPDDDLYIIGAVCDEKVTSSLICSATVAGEIYI